MGNRSAGSLFAPPPEPVFIVRRNSSSVKDEKMDADPTAAQPEMPLKRCSQCGEWKPATPEYFHKRRNGFVSLCKECYSAYHAEYSARHREKKAAFNKAYYAANCDAISAQGKEYRRKCQERNLVVLNALRAVVLMRVAVRGPLYYETHKNELAARRTAGMLNQDRKARAYGQRQEALKRSLPYLWSADYMGRMVNAWNGRCAYCSSKLDETMHIDHYIPMKAKVFCPGTVPWNLLPSCEVCNLNKHSSMPVAWIRRTFGKAAPVIIARIEAYFQEVSPSKAERRAARCTHKQLSFDLD